MLPTDTITDARYEVVIVDPEAGLTVQYYSVDDLSGELAGRGFVFSGLNRNPAHRAALQGQPKFTGLCGPMFGGPGVVRYETPAAYARLSA